MTAQRIVLVTGVNGYIASRTADAFLRAGFDVRGTVRSIGKQSSILTALQAFPGFSLVGVPDITAEGAFDEAVKGVYAIAHLAAPVSLSFTEAAPVMHAAINGTRRVLESAVKEPSIKSVVLMSSVAAVTEIREGEYTFTEKDWNRQALDAVERLGDNAPGAAIYAASKTASEKEFWKFRDENKISFSMSTINPVFVTGPPLVRPASPDDVPATASPIYHLLAGADPTTMPPIMARFVDVRDVARLVLFAVEESAVANGERYLASSAYAPPQGLADILHPAYPKNVKEGNPGTGYGKGFKPINGQVVDASKAVRASGKDYIPFETTVLDTAEMFYPLVTKD